MAPDTSAHGALNGHAVGIILKELVRRATTTIRAERLAFEVSQKVGYSPDMTDVFTSADRKAQAIYVRSLRECFPDHGILGEEDGLALDAARDDVGYFTVDPLDGTRAFIRRQSHGVGTMIALVERGEIVSAYVGDVNTQEIYGYRPGSTSVHRISAYETAERLSHTARPLGEQYVLLRDPPKDYSPAARRVIDRFKSYEVEGGSIGIWLARLWKREVAAALLTPAAETPWDATPIYGISWHLGYALYRPTARGDAWEPWRPPPPRAVTQRDHDLLVVHRDDAAALELTG